jgi:hypothetical protein
MRSWTYPHQQAMLYISNTGDPFRLHMTTSSFFFVLTLIAVCRFEFLNVGRKMPRMYTQAQHNHDKCKRDMERTWMRFIINEKTGAPGSHLSDLRHPARPARERSTVFLEVPGVPGGVPVARDSKSPTRSISGTAQSFLNTSAQPTCLLAASDGGAAQRAEEMRQHHIAPRFLLVPSLGCLRRIPFSWAKRQMLY